MHATELTGVIADHIAGVNALDTDAIMATFADDAYVNDARREFTGDRRDPALGGEGNGRRQGPDRGPRGAGPLR